MSLKQEIETWVQALTHYDNNEFEEALKCFEPIADTSKILFNCGVIHATLGAHQLAVECYQKSVRLDQYFAVAYFQQGVSNFLLEDFEEALANFNDSLLYLRGNAFIDYDQLGLKFKLYSCEVLFNRGLCYIYLQQKEAGMIDFSYAVKEKSLEDHDVIDEAIKDEAEGYTVFSIPVGVVYRPNESKVKNLKTKDYLGKARLIAASDRSNTFTGFSGSEIKKSMDTSKDAKDDRLPDNISFAASNLVKPGLQSRVRQQSAPPVSHNIFPPTPPPESDKAESMAGRAPQDQSMGGMTGRAMSVRSGGSSGGGSGGSVTSGGSKAEKYDIPKGGDLRERGRIGTIRTASEPRGPSSRSGSKTRLRARQFASRRRIYSDEDDDEYPGDLYDMYRGGERRAPELQRRGTARSNARPRYIEEEDENSDIYEGDSLDEDDFEMLSGTRRRSNFSRSNTKRQAEVTKIRAKVHAGDDARFIMVGTAVEYQDLMDRIRGKFGLRSRFRCKVRDEDAPDGDMITLGDQDDLDMAISAAKEEAKRERADMGKMEPNISQNEQIWTQEY
ncbi:hypothetical protein FGG08_005971 [Glutinoglossum americanum]|uniref:PB1 domain-containing protein n=1 Tax=Glutinoglossum americanum TaxID=1670608 RepID=A0A9P8HX40_9PEZI|nr:hypothetical protein FGG08_005971 [Glutinoglossum americanum]